MVMLPMLGMEVAMWKACGEESDGAVKEWPRIDSRAMTSPAGGEWFGVPDERIMDGKCWVRESRTVDHFLEIGCCRCRGGG